MSKPMSSQLHTDEKTSVEEVKVMSKVYTMMVTEAADLFSDIGEWGGNPEYLRGMCELIARMFPVRNVPTDERAEEVRRAIRAANGSDKP